jgi:ligand-binding SRPBCC domain-containing protein
VLSTKGGFLKQLSTPISYFAGAIPGNGKQTISWIHIDDLVSSLVVALENDKMKGAFNAVAPAPTTNQDFTKTLAGLLHRPSFAAAPKLALNLVLQEKSVILTASQRVLPSALESQKFSFKYKELREALHAELKCEQQGEDVFFSQQYLPLPPEELFPFFADAHNLENITPSTLNFKILSVSTPQIQSGTLIEYSLNIRGVPVKWKTEIQNWNPPHEFVDNQLKGPYKLWHHTHTFLPLGKGTLMIDRVRFKPPLGILGWLTSITLVRKEVSGIFAYRREVIHKLFVEPRKQ